MVLGALGVESSGELVDTILLEFDENQDGQIQFVELVKYLGTGTSASSDKLQHHVDALKVRFTAVCVGVAVIRGRIYYFCLILFRVILH